MEGRRRWKAPTYVAAAAVPTNRFATAPTEKSALKNEESCPLWCPEWQDNTSQWGMNDKGSLTADRRDPLRYKDEYLIVHGGQELFVGSCLFQAAFEEFHGFEGIHVG